MRLPSDHPVAITRRAFLGHGAMSVGVTALAGGPATSATLNAADAVAARTVPALGIMLNHDGNHSFTDLDPGRSEAALRAKVRSLEGTAVRTLIFQVAAGSEIMLFPSRTGSAWGWRKAPGESEPPWDTQMPFLRAAAANGLDAGRVAGLEARAMGLYFLPGYRMNDAHFSSKPFEHPATGRFWIEHHERFRIGRAPSERMQFVANLLDYSHSEVRAHRLAIVREIIQRYADIMDGVQLDFMRQPYLFPPGTGEARRDLMTEFIAQVRATLDEAGRRHGRFLCLSARVPPTLQGCRWAGLDVPAWLQQKLVNVLVPSPAMTLAHDMPVDQFVALAEPVGAKVFPAVFRHTPFTWPFAMEPTSEKYHRSPGRTVTAAQVRGAALNYLPMGAAGFELFNFNLPPAPFTTEAINALARPRDGERIYAITQAYASDREDAAENRKQIPVALLPTTPVELTLIVGEKLGELDLRNKIHAVLRLGLHGMARQPAAIRVAINDQPVYSGPVARIATWVTGRESQPSKLNPPRVETYLQVRLADSVIFHAGRNRLSLRLDFSGKDSGETVELVEVQLAVMDGD